MRIRDFSGGINKRLDPTLIAQNEAQELINADISSGALCAAKGSKTLTDGQFEKFYESNSIGINTGQFSPFFKIPASEPNKTLLCIGIYDTLEKISSIANLIDFNNTKNNTYLLTGSFNDSSFNYKATIESLAISSTSLTIWFRIPDNTPLTVVFSGSITLQIQRYANFKNMDIPEANGQILPENAATDFGFFDSKNFGYFSENKRSHVEFRDKVYFTEDGKPQVYENLNQVSELGIRQPTEQEVKNIDITATSARTDWAPSLVEIDNPDRTAAATAGNTDNFVGTINYEQGKPLNKVITSLRLKLTHYYSYKRRPKWYRSHVTYHVYHRKEVNIGSCLTSNFSVDMTGSINSGHSMYAQINGESKWHRLRRNGNRFYLQSNAEQTGPLVGVDTNFGRITYKNNLPPLRTTIPTLFYRKTAGDGTTGRQYYLLSAATLDGTNTHHYNFDIENQDGNTMQFIIYDTAENNTYELYQRNGSNATQLKFLGTFERVPDRHSIHVEDNTMNLDDVSISTYAANTGNQVPIGNETTGTNPPVVPSDSQYAITYVNEEKFIESVPRLINKILPGNAALKLLNLPVAGNSDATHLYVYRVDNTRPVFSFIGKKPIRTGAAVAGDDIFEDYYSGSTDGLFIYTALGPFSADVISGTAPNKTTLTKTTTSSGATSITHLDGSETRATDSKLRGYIGYWDGIHFNPPANYSLEPPSEGAYIRINVKLSVSTETEGTSTLTTYTATYRKENYEVIQEEDILGSALGQTITSLRNYEPPELKYLTLYNNTFFGVGLQGNETANVLYFSRIGRPHYWPKENFIEFENAIQGLLEVHQGLLIFTLNKTYLLTGYSAETFQIAVVSEEYGMIPNGHSTGSFARSIPLWITKDGIATYQNGRVEILSRDKLDHHYPWTEVENCQFCDDQYFVLFKNTDEAGDKGHVILAFDLRFNPRFVEYHLIADGEGMTIENSGPISLTNYGECLGYIEGRPNDPTANEPTIINTFKIAFAGDSKLNMTYKGPTFTEGSPATLKNYSFYYISKTGQVRISLEKDTVTDTQTQLIPECNIENQNKLAIPGGKSRAYSITPTFTGDGCVREFYLEPTRETQKDR